MSTCPDHKKEILYICFDKACKKNPNSCVLCIKNDHIKCKDDMIVEKDKAGFKI